MTNTIVKILHLELPRDIPFLPLETLFSTNTTIQTILLYNLLPISFPDVASLLRCHSTLQSLTLCSSRFGSLELTPIIYALSLNTRLTSLYLSAVPITPMTSPHYSF